MLYALVPLNVLTQTFHVITFLEVLISKYFAIHLDFPRRAFWTNLMVTYGLADLMSSGRQDIAATNTGVMLTSRPYILSIIGISAVLALTFFLSREMEVN